MPRQMTVKAIATPGSGTLTMCRNWLLFAAAAFTTTSSCRRRIAVGDKVPLRFGSNPKDYAFPVKRITRDGDTCAVLSQPPAIPENANKIEVAFLSGRGRYTP